MSEDDYIGAVKRNHPDMLLPDRKIVFRFPGLEALLRDAFRRGEAHGAAGAEQAPPQPGPLPSADEGRGGSQGGADGERLFNSLFGSFRK